MRYVSNRFATEPTGDVLLVNGFMRFNRNAYNESSNPEVSRVPYTMLISSLAAPAPSNNLASV